MVIDEWFTSAVATASAAQAPCGLSVVTMDRHASVDRPMVTAAESAAERTAGQSGWSIWSYGRKAYRVSEIAVRCFGSTL